MRKIIFVIVCSILLTAGFFSMDVHAGQTDDATDTDGNDSTVNVIGWFSKNDTLEYWISQGRWKINGKDTVKTTGVASKVRLVVTDSTATGYKMDYTFLEFLGDSVAESSLGDFQNRLVEKLGKKVVGTTIQFETDEYGTITKYNNLGQIKKQAKSLFKDAMKEFLEMPEVKGLKDMGLDLKDYVKGVDTDQLVDGYLEELKLLFLCHGLTYDIGESNSHEDATETSYENHTYTTVSTDDENGTYSISTEVVNIVPQSDIKALVGGIVGELKDKSIAENFEKEFDKQVRIDATISSYFSSDYMPDGWPYRVVKQETTMIGDSGKAAQTYIYLDYLSVHNN